MVKKIVLTGTACCGKTTLIKELYKKHPVIEESAREIISSRSHLPLDVDEEIIRQQLITIHQMEKEIHFSSLHKDKEFIFLDRSLIDVSVYSQKTFGYVPEDLERFINSNPYHSVFFLETLPLENDDVRRENEEERNALQRDLKKFYNNFGYSPTYLPRMSVKKRADFILHYLEGCI